MSPERTPDPLNDDWPGVAEGEPFPGSDELDNGDGADTAGDGDRDVLSDEAASVDDVSADIAELTADVQRLQAEYANYRRRVDRDREQIREQAVASTLGELVGVLDDIGRARAHDELVGAFRSVGESLEATVAKLGLERFGAVGDPFDPAIHEALTHLLSPDVTETTCVEVYQPGYRFAGRVVRPARVVVADPS